MWRPARWANWMFEVGNYDSATNNFTFGKGGFQGARGSNSGGDWFIENVMEELDNPVRQKSDSYRTHTRLALHTHAPIPPPYKWVLTQLFIDAALQGEFFFEKKTGDLYLVHNGTGAPPADATFVVPQKQVLVNMSGSQWDPVTNVKLVGITYTAAASTYMEPHG